MFKKQFKLLVVVFMIGVAFSAFAQVPPDLEDLQKGVSDFSKELAKSLPFNSSLGLNWSDAYVGKLIPSVPPHFGIGLSFGFTTMEMKVIKDLAGYFNVAIPFNISKMILPAYTAEARIGGLFLPFDVGFKIGYLPDVGLWGSGIKVHYFLVGGDIRYALLDGKILPKISIGVGFNHMKAGIGKKIGTDMEFDYDTGTITVEAPDVSLKWDTTSLDFKAQLSKSFIIITPYIGIGGSYAWSSAGYSVAAKITCDDIDEANNYLEAAGLPGINLEDQVLSSIMKNKAFSFRAFGGFSINIIKVLRLDLTGLYSFRDKNFGASFGARFQL